MKGGLRAGMALLLLILSGDIQAFGRGFRRHGGTGLAPRDVSARPAGAAEPIKTHEGCRPPGGVEARPDLTVSLKASMPSAPRQDVSLNITVKNIGAGSAPPSVCDVIIRNARPPRQELRRYQGAIPALEP